MAESRALPTCPMAKACASMTGKPGSGVWMALPGLALIALGVAIIMFPRILTWLVAIALICMGSALLLMLNFMRSIGKRLQSPPSQSAL